MPEAMMRLGELRWEVEREGFLARFKAWEARPVDQRGPTPEPDFKPSRELFGKVLADYAWFGEYDLALYADGFLATQEGKQDDALARFERILKEYPGSRFTADAHMIKAETLLADKYDYPGALAEYEAVLKFPGTDLYGLALFKSAWCLWRLGNTDEAAKRFVSVFALSEAGGVNGQAKNVRDRKQLDELQAEALKYLVEVLTEDEKNTAADAYAFLRKMGSDRFAGKVVKALAETYYDQSHYERGIEAYELLLKLDPTSRDAGDWMLQIASGYFTIEDYAHLKSTYERALTVYTAGGAWSRTQADPANVAATTTKIEQQLREHAQALHGKAQHDKTSRAEFEATAALYDTYLSRFSGEPTAFEIQYYEGEVDFYHLGNMTDAATHYEASARAMPAEKAKQEPWASQRKDALRNALTAIGRVRADEFAARKGKTTTTLGETATDKKFAEVTHAVRGALPRRARPAGALLPAGEALLRLQSLRLGCEALGEPPREVPELAVRAACGRARARLVQQGQRLRQHRDLGPEAQDGARLRVRFAARAARRADRAGCVQAGGAEGDGGGSPRRRGGVSPRCEGVPEGRTRGPGMRQRGARGAEGG